jgi:hypothetical protein
MANHTWWRVVSLPSAMSASSSTRWLQYHDQFFQWICIAEFLIIYCLVIEAQLNQDRMSNSQNFHLWSTNNPHRTTERAFQYRFSVKVWCSLIGDSWVDHLCICVGTMFNCWWISELPDTWIATTGRCASGKKTQDLLSALWGISTFWLSYSLLELVLQKSLDWSLWSSALAAKISGPDPTWFLYMVV